jgi:trans-aconitate methyltransferase
MVKSTGFTSMTDEYERLGVDEYYRKHSADYRNVHFPEISAAMDEVLSQFVQRTGSMGCCRVLDLACGSGEATLAATRWQAHHPVPTMSIDGADPYTSPAYKDRTRRTAMTFSFQDIAMGCLTSQGLQYELCVCSFALHLIRDKSWLWRTLSALAESCAYLALLSPHKKPEVAHNTGWLLVHEAVVQRVRLRLFRSTMFSATSLQESETSA